MGHTADSGIYMLSGLIGGAASAVTSHPADTLLSKVNKNKGRDGESITSRLISTSRELGIRGLFTGLTPRIIMVACMSAGQFLIYGDIKCILGATGGVEIQKIDKKRNTNT